MDILAKSNDGASATGTTAPADFPETADIHSSSDEYAGRFAGKTGAWMLDVQERITLEFLKQHDVRTILDVGGGHGQLAHPLCRDGYDVTVLSSSQECVHRIRDIVESGRCKFQIGNVIALPYPDRSFDAVISFRMVTHCEQWQKLIAELCRVAKNVVIVDYPTSQSLNSIAPALFDAKKKLEKNTRRWRLFRHEEITGEITRNGFRIANRTGQFFFPMVLHRIIKLKPVSAALEGISRALGLNRRWGTPVIVSLTR